MSVMSTITTSVMRKVDHGDVMELRLKRPIGYNFTPGQCIDLHDDQGNFRPYSIASGSKRECITLYIKRVPGGKVTSWVETLRTNDMVRISKEAYGFFTPGETDKPFVFIATGTGVAPFLSYIESHADIPDVYSVAPKGAFLGCRRLEEAIESATITEFAEEYRYCISQDDIDGYQDICFKGRVTEFLKSDWDIDPDAMYYLCGLDAMLSEVSEILNDAGVPPENIQQELFYFTGTFN